MEVFHAVIVQALRLLVVQTEFLYRLNLIEIYFYILFLTFIAPNPVATRKLIANMALSFQRFAAVAYSIALYVEEMLAARLNDSPSLIAQVTLQVTCCACSPNRTLCLLLQYLRFIKAAHFVGEEAEDGDEEAYYTYAQNYISQILQTNRQRFIVLVVAFISSLFFQHYKRSNLCDLQHDSQHSRSSNAKSIIFLHQSTEAKVEHLNIEQFLNPKPAWQAVFVGAGWYRHFSKTMRQRVKEVVNVCSRHWVFGVCGAMMTSMERMMMVGVAI